jgi:hypothetical protein
MPVEQILRKAVDLHLRYVKALGQMTADHVKQFIEVLDERHSAPAGQPSSAPHSPSAGPSSHAMLFEGTAGTGAVAAFMLENHLPDTVEAVIKASPLRSPAGDILNLAFHFDPPSISLKSREKALIRVTVFIPEDIAADTPYAGNLLVPEIKGASVPVEVRRRLIPHPPAPPAEVA